MRNTQLGSRKLGKIARIRKLDRNCRYSKSRYSKMERKKKREKEEEEIQIDTQRKREKETEIGLSRWLICFPCCQNQITKGQPK